MPNKLEFVIIQADDVRDRTTPRVFTDRVLDGVKSATDKILQERRFLSGKKFLQEDILKIVDTALSEALDTLERTLKVQRIP